MTHADVAEISRGLTEVERDPALTWLFGRCYHRLVRDLGRFGAEVGEWPNLPDALGGPGRYFYV